MKKKIFFFTLLTIFLFSCGQSNVSDEDTGFNQTVEIAVDGKKYHLSSEDILTLTYVGQTHLGFGILSEKNDMQFMFSAFLTELKLGTYQVWDCKSASSCDQEMDDKNQTALFGPYPKDSSPPISLSRTAYDASELELKPLTLIITSIADDQQSGVPFKTKRVKGQYSGTLVSLY